MRKKRAAAAVVAATALAVGLLLHRGTDAPLPVQAVRVTRGDVAQTVLLTGAVRYASEYAAVAPWTGIVSQVYVQPGDAVTAGQALFRMDDAAEVSAVSAALGAASLSAYAEQAAQARLRLDGLTVRARTDGVVQQVSVSGGSGVAGGAAAVLLTGEEQRILCSAVTRDAAQLRSGMAARILAGGAALCTGRVERIGAAQADPHTGQTVCEVAVIPDQPVQLPLGAAVEAEVILAGASGVTVLPSSALTAEDAVWWIADDRVWHTPVTVPLRYAALCWVSLPEGAQVVDEPSALTDGQRVEVCP